MQILTAFALLIPAFSLLYTPQPLALLFLRVYNAPLPSVLRRCLSFGVRFSPLNSPRKDARPVSYYALLNEWLLLSQHPGCLRIFTSFST